MNPLLLLLRKGWTWAAIMAALLAISVIKNKLTVLEWELEKQELQVKIEEAKADALAREKELILAHQQALDEYINTIKVTNDQQTQILSDLNAGVVRLRSRFQCPSTVPSPATPASSNNGTGQAGLLNSDAEFLVRFAADADRRVNQLTACQNLIKEYNEKLRARQE